MDIRTARLDYIARFTRATEHLLTLEELCRREPDATLRKSRLQKFARLIDASGRAVLGEVFVVTEADLDTMPAVRIWLDLAEDPVAGREGITVGAAIDRLNVLDWRDGVPINGVLLDLVMAHHVTLELIVALADPALFWRPDRLGLGAPVDGFKAMIAQTRRALAGAVVVMKKLGSDPTFRLSDLPPCHRVGYPHLAVLEPRA